MPDAYLTPWRSPSICVCLKNIISGDAALEMGGVIKDALFKAVLSAILLLASPLSSFFTQQLESFSGGNLEIYIYSLTAAERGLRFFHLGVSLFSAISEEWQLDSGGLHLSAAHHKKK